MQTTSIEEEKEEDNEEEEKRLMKWTQNNIDHGNSYCPTVCESKKLAMLKKIYTWARWFDWEGEYETDRLWLFIFHIETGRSALYINSITF